MSLNKCYTINGYSYNIIITTLSTTIKAIKWKTLTRYEMKPYLHKEDMLGIEGKEKKDQKIYTWNDFFSRCVSDRIYAMKLKINVDGDSLVLSAFQILVGIGPYKRKNMLIN